MQGVEFRRVGGKPGVIRDLGADPPLDGVQGVECSNHFAPTNNQALGSPRPSAF